VRKKENRTGLTLVRKKQETEQNRTGQDRTGRGGVGYGMGWNGGTRQWNTGRRIGRGRGVDS